MKNLLFFGSFLMILFSACAEESSNQHDSDFTLEIINQNLEDSIATFSWKDSTYEISLNMGDTQSLVLPVQESNVGVIKVAKSQIQLFVGPGESLSITLSMEEDELDAQYAGSLAAAKNASMQIQKDVLGQYPYNNPYAFYGMGVDSFQFYIDQAMNSMDSLLQDLSKKQPEWADIVKSHMGYRINDYAVNYPVYHPSVAKLDSFDVDPAYWDNFAVQFSVFEEKLLQLESKQSLTYSYVQNLYYASTDTFIKDDSTRIATLFHWADSIYNSEALQKTFKVSLLDEQITYGGVGSFSDWLTEQVYAFTEDEDRKAKLLSKITDWEKIAQGAPAPDFTGQTVDSTTIALSDLKGKVVYVDVWATWCGPCRQEIPHLETMYEKYAEEENLALVSVSIDSDYDAWYKMVTEDNMGGIQLFTENAWESDLNQSYLIQAIPRFLLIGKDGNIISADAPRPSSKEEIYSLIEEAL
jgi:thiol-disulfide isomerase/thioredoxin